jgi:hypothetical protein
VKAQALLAMAGVCAAALVLALAVRAWPADSAPAPKQGPLDNLTCERLAALHLALDRLKRVKDDTAALDVRTMHLQLTGAEIDAMETIKDRIGNLTPDELEEAHQRLKAAIAALPDDGTIGTSTEALREPAAALARIENGLRVRLGCD